MFLSSCLFVVTAMFWGALMAVKVFVSSLFQQNTKKRSSIPDVLRDPRYGQHEYINLTNVKLHYVHRGSRDKPLMLFIHGFPEFWYSWRHQMEEFSKDYWTVAVDMRGYGESEKKAKVSDYKLPRLVEDVRQLIIALGKEKCVLVGHDWGGVVAHHFIRKHPEMLHHYILMNTMYATSFNDIVLKSWKQYLKSWYIFVFQIPCLAEKMILANDIEVMDQIFKKSPPYDIEAYKFTFRDFEHVNGPINYYRANTKPWAKREHLTEDKLNKAAVRGLYIHAINDVAITPEAALEASWRGVNDVTKVTVDKGDHFVQTSAPEEVNRIMSEFLTK